MPANISLFFLLFCSVASVNLHSEENHQESASPLRISKLSLNATEREFSIRLLNDFARQFPHIKTELSVKNEVNYKLHVVDKVSQGTLDVAQWFGGEPICELARRGLLLPVSDLWASSSWGSAYPRGSVTCDNEQYGVPYVTYHWGFYYNVELFEKLSLKVPTDWKSFLSVSSVLQQNGVSPIGMGTQSRWLLLAWLDYLNLRINGPEFHRDTIKGKHAFTSAPLVEVFEHWSELIKQNYFYHAHHESDWQALVPALARQQIGMFLIGGFIEHQSPKIISQRLEPFAFPIIDVEQPVVEVAPTEVFMASAKTQQPEAAKAFLNFISQPDVQALWDNRIGVTPIFRVTDREDINLAQRGSMILNKADEFAEFFDRQASPQFTRLVEEALLKFIDSGDVAAVTKELEQARLSVFVNND